MQLLDQLSVAGHVCVSILNRGLPLSDGFVGLTLMIVSAETELCEFLQNPRGDFRRPRSYRTEDRANPNIFIGDVLAASLPKSIFADAARGVAPGANYVQDLL